MLDVPELEADLKRIYGLGYYESVGWSLAPTEAGPVLVIRAREKSWGPNYLSFGLNYEDNFEGNTRFNLAAGLRMTELNRLGAEWLTGVQLGTQPWVRSQWYQPLTFGYDRFAVVGVEYRRDDYSIYDQGRRISEVDVTFRQVDLALGMELGGNGEVRLAYVRGYATVEDEVGVPVAPADNVHQGHVSLQLVHDSLSDAFFPKSGAFAGIRGRVEREDLGSDRHFDGVTAMLLGTGTWERFNLTGLLYTRQIFSGDAGIENAARLGGFRQLSAYAPGKLPATTPCWRLCTVGGSLVVRSCPGLPAPVLKPAMPGTVCVMPAGVTRCGPGVLLLAWIPCLGQCNWPLPIITRITGRPT